MSTMNIYMLGKAPLLLITPMHLRRQQFMTSKMKKINYKNGIAKLTFYAKPP